MKRQLIIEGSPQFDLRTTIRDPKTGKTIKQQDYIRFVSQEHGEFYKCMETGTFFDPQGNEIQNPKLPASKVEIVKK